MVNDRFNLCKRSLAWMRYLLRKLGYTKDEIGFNFNTRLVLNKYGLPINFIVMDGSVADCDEIVHLIKNIDIKLLFVTQIRFCLILRTYEKKHNTTHSTKMQSHLPARYFLHVITIYLKTQIIDIQIHFYFFQSLKFVDLCCYL